MDRYRDRTTGEIKTKSQLLAANAGKSFPKVWGEFVYDDLNVDPLLNQPPPPPSDIPRFKRAERNGAVQDSNGQWLEAWHLVDMFADDDELGTKEEQEAAYQAETDAAWSDKMRRERSERLKETDWWAVSDRTMTSEQTAYRTALRDLPTHSNWPYLEDDDWPTKPS